jgi:mercuric ion transport protein
LPDARVAPPLTLAGVAALLSSTCCVLPLVFAIVGVSGAWIGQLHRLEPYSYPLTAVAAASLLIAGWRIRRARTADQCDIDGCVQRNAAARRWFWVLAVLTVLPIAVRQGAHFFY